MFNVDDYAYAFINQYYVIFQNLFADSGLIDVTTYIRNGSNDFTFLTYNVDSAYNWGFQIIRNGVVVFYDTAGFIRATGANNNDGSKSNQFVYNKTISMNVTKCPTITTTPSTGELLWLM